MNTAHNPKRVNNAYPLTSCAYIICGAERDMRSDAQKAVHLSKRLFVKRYKIRIARIDDKIDGMRTDIKDSPASSLQMCNMEW
jgi:hypothetical protein